MKFGLILLGGFVPATVAVPFDQYQVHEQRGPLHQQWIKGQQASGSTVVPVRIALKQSNLEKAEDYLLQVSDPASPKYGQHFTTQQIVDLFAPSEQSINQVKTWLVSSGIPAGSIALSNSKGWINFNTTASELESLLKTKFYLYTNNATDGVYFGTEAYSLPHDVSSLVDFVMPGISFTQMQKKTARIAHPSSSKLQGASIDPNGTDHCDTYVTPRCISALYQIPPAKLANPNNTLGIFETEGDVYSQEDLNQFYAAAAPGIPKGTGPIIHLINGATAPNPPSSAGTESDLDFEIAIPIIYPQKTSLYQIQYPGNAGYKNFNYIFNDFLDAFSGPYCHDNGDEGSGKECNDLTPPNVLSVSWGDSEDPSLVSFHKVRRRACIAPEARIQPNHDFAQRQCTEWMKYGLQGTSVFVASGDYGVAENTCLGPKQNIFVPDGLCGCPYITAVGSTYLPKGAKVGDSEVATERFSSGGGFSNIFATPEWQHSAVSEYLTEHKPSYKSYNTTDGKLPSSGGIYNRGGRGYPDISAIGDNGVVVVGGSQGTIGGTSMSAPLVAAIFNRINEERLNIGKSPVGFINPALYKAYSKKAFNDITKGDQPGGGGCGTTGFSAASGWDPVTGLGTPKYTQLLEYFLSL
ncbi:peptidase S53 family protein [Metarhizium robertsii]|uniref:Peptidase S53 family protein n=1 Tax=Metarhizium robertsii TaxID=568076 RepID=A0A0A1V9G6_9HYPO|nr:peptidase S53 family protein [Metarhizium robertsii]